MGLESLCKEILERAHTQAEEADKEASAQMHEIVRQAHVQAKATLEEAQEEGKAFVDSERSEKLSAARLEAGRLLSEARESAVNSALEKVWAEFAKRRQMAGYREALGRLAKKAVDELGHPKPVVFANAQDAKLLRGKYRISDKALDCAGGVAAETPDGKIRVDYTFEEIFTHSREAVRKEIYARMEMHEGDAPQAAVRKMKKPKAKSKKAKMAAKKKARRKR